MSFKVNIVYKITPFGAKNGIFFEDQLKIKTYLDNKLLNSFQFYYFVRFYCLKVVSSEN
jgi:hypothetical protein